MSALTFDRRQHVAATAARSRDGIRVMRLAIAAVGLHRAISLTTVLAGGAGLTTASMTVAFGVVATWGCVFIVDSWRRGAFRRRWAVLDVTLAVAVGLLGLTWGTSGMRFSYGLLQGAALVAGCALPARALPVAVSGLVSIKALAMLVPPPWARIDLTEFAAYAATLVALAVGAAIADRALRLAADMIDRSRNDLAEQRRLLHDTALATLNAIANGALDANAEQVRARAARDAAYLRLIMQGGRLSPGGLPAALATAAADATALDLRVHTMCEALPSDLDPPVVAAIAMAAREALNNIHRHAHTGQAWLTAAEEGGTLVVRIVDRGSGFTPALAKAGSGIRDSIVARMREAGGLAWIESAPGQGTCVELRWPQ